MVVAATGFFDGVHLGHRIVLDKVKELAKEQGKESAIISFWPHPRNVLQKDAESLRLLSSLDEKRELIKSLGIDNFYIIPFTKQLSQLSQEQFLKEYLVDKFDVSTLVIGYDHRVGKDAGNDPNKVAKLARSMGVESYVTNALNLNSSAVSSTKIRNLLSGGEVNEASELLGYDYFLKGVVVAGNKIGRTIGFPTANMQLYEPIKLVPKKGVYVVKVSVIGEEYIGVCNIGNRPTIGNNNSLTIETYILGFSENIYGLDIKIEFLEKIRDEKKFESLEMLKEQLIKDSSMALKFLD